MRRPHLPSRTKRILDICHGQSDCWLTTIVLNVMELLESVKKPTSLLVHVCQPKAQQSKTLWLQIHTM